MNDEILLNDPNDDDACIVMDAIDAINDMQESQESPEN